MEQTQENMEGRGGPGEANGRRSSDVWNHFTASKDGNGNDIATCNSCQKSYGADPKKHGTNHLKRHIGKCRRQDGGPPPKQPRRPLLTRPSTDPAGEEPSALMLDPSSSSNLQAESPPTRPAQSSWFNQEECGAELAQMIAFHGYSSSIVEDECFRSFVRGLNPHFQMPSRAAVEGTCRRRAQDATNKLKETLARCSGQISLATGTAETGQGKALYMACQFIDDEWSMQKRIVQVFSVVSFPPYHHGALLGIDEVSIELNEGILEQLSLARTSGMLEEAARRWGLPGRLFSVAWCHELETHLERKDFLDDLCPYIQIGEQGPIEIPVVFCVTYTSDALNSAADAIYSKLSTYFEENCFKAVKGLRLDQEKRARYFSELALNHVGRYDKRWYSYYCALEVLHKEFTDNNAALVEPPPLKESQLREVLGGSRLNSRQVRALLGLSRFKENQLTELLRKILGMIYRAIQRISSSSFPTSNLCIEELMKLRAVLQSEAKDARQDVTKAVAYAKIDGFGGGKDVDTVLQDAQGVLDTFLQEGYLYLSIPAVLDPRFKLKYVTSVVMEVFGSEAPGYISRVKERMEDIFHEHRRKRRNAANNDEGTSTAAVDIDSNPLDESIMELERYLADGLVPREEGEGFDVLTWWKANSYKYPTVASMARDALAMPASDMLSPEHLALIRSMTSSYCVTYPEAPSDD